MTPDTQLAVYKINVWKLGDQIGSDDCLASGRVRRNLAGKETLPVFGSKYQFDRYFCWQLLAPARQLSSAENSRGPMGKCVHKRIAGIFEKGAKHHVHQHAIEFEIELEYNFATFVTEVRKSPATLQVTKRPTDKRYANSVKFVTGIARRKLVAHAAFLQFKCRLDKLVCSLVNLRTLAPGQEFRIRTDVVHQYEHLPRRIRHQCIAVDVSHKSVPAPG